MIRPRLRLSLALLLALGAIPGPGCKKKAPPPPVRPARGAPKETVATPTPKAVLEARHEAELAQSLLVAARDVPAAWTSEPASAGRANPFAGCGRIGGDRQRGPAEVAAARSLEFHPAPQEQPLDTLAETVVLFGDAGEAATILKAAPRAFECRAQAVAGGKANVDGAVRFQAVKLLPSPLHALGGSNQQAARFQGAGTTAYDSSETELTLDVAVVGEGRALVLIEALGVGAPPDARVVQQFATQAIEKVKAARP